MKMIYTIYDKIAKTSNGLFLAENDDDARRMFQLWKDDPKSNKVNFDDFCIFALGSYDPKVPIIDDIQSIDITIKDLEDD